MTTINGKPYKIFEPANFPQYIQLEPIVPEGYFDIASNEDMIAVEDWCLQNNCGKRSGWNKFYFDNDAQITMFKLRWG